MTTYQQNALAYYLIPVAIVLLIIGGLAWHGSGIFGLPFGVMLKSIIGLFAVGIVGYIYSKVDIYLPKVFIYPVAAVTILLCLFPILNHIALEHSAKNFYETTNFLGQSVREFGANEITVWWGAFYAKIAYAILAALIGYGLAVISED